MSPEGKAVDYTVAAANDDNMPQQRGGFRTIPDSICRPAASKRFHASHEWVPITLRLPIALVFTLCLLLCAAGLEILDVGIKTAQGIPERNRSQVLAIRYVPTIFVIILGFAWKALVFDLSVITPWSAMSNQWKAASDSILLNYVDSLDVVNIWTSFRQRHWALCLTGACGLLAGAMVPLANALSYVDLNAKLSFGAQLNQDGTFVFNGSLASPLGWRGIRPFEAFKLAMLTGPNHTILPWTATGLTFESFSLPDTKRLGNVNITAPSNAFSAYLSCEQITYTTTQQDQDVNSTITLQGHVGDCALPITQQVRFPFNRTNIWEVHTMGSNGNWNLSAVAWSNITSCNGPDDWRILATLLDMHLRGNISYLGKHSPDNATLLLDLDAKFNISTSGLICKPMYMLTAATVHINGTTGWVQNYELHENETKHIDIGISTELAHAQIQNPLEVDSREVFLAAATNDWHPTASLPNSYNWSVFPDLHVMQEWSWLYLWHNSSLGDATMKLDPFFGYIFMGNYSILPRLWSDRNFFASTVSRRFSMHLVQLVNYNGRSKGEKGEGVVYGSIEDYGSRLFVRQVTLTVLQTILILLAAVAACCASLLRPRTVLGENPASLGLVSVVLASSVEADKSFRDYYSSSDASMRSMLKNCIVRLTRSVRGASVLEVASRGEHEDSEAGERRRESVQDQPPSAMLLFQAPSQLSSLRARMSRSSTFPFSDGRYRPFSLRLFNRWIVAALLALATIAVGVVFRLSQHVNGFQYRSTGGEAWSYLPTTILVLIGYGVQGIQTSVFRLERFRALQRRKAVGWDVCVRQRVDIFLRRLRTRTLSILWFSCVLLAALFPVIKIVVGGLYNPEYAPYPYPGNTTFDRAAFDHFYNFPRKLDPAAQQRYTNIIGAECVARSMLPDWSTLLQLETLENLNIPLITSNFTAQMPNDGQANLDKSTFTMRTIAIKTDSDCTPSKDSDFALMATCLGENKYQFRWECASSECEGQFKPALNLVNFTLAILEDSNLSNQAAAHPWYHSVAYPNALDSSFTALVADFTSLTGPLYNLSSLCPASGTNSTKRASQAELGVPLPSIKGAHCARSMAQVRVNVTYSVRPSDRPVFVTFAVSKWLKQLWIPKSYDAASVEHLETLDATNSPAIFLPNGGVPQSHVGSSLTPFIDPYNFLSLIAQSQEVRTGSVLDLFDVNQLVASTKRVYEVSSVQMVRAMISVVRDRYWSSDAYPDPNIVHVNGEFAVYRQVVKQDLGFSVAMIVLLSITIAIVVYISVAMPRKTILPRAPSSIAAQLSFLAGSRLVKELREEGVVKTTDTTVWNQRVGLGWWPAAEEGKSGFRWGIDIGVPDRRFPGLVAPADDPEDQDGNYEAAKHNDYTTDSDGAETRETFRHGEFDFEGHEEGEGGDELARSMILSFATNDIEFGRHGKGNTEGTGRRPSFAARESEDERHEEENGEGHLAESIRLSGVAVKMQS